MQEIKLDILSNANRIEKNKIRGILFENQNQTERQKIKNKVGVESRHLKKFSRLMINNRRSENSID